MQLIAVHAALGALILMLVVLVISTVCRRAPIPPFSAFGHACPNAWVGFQGKCYYFSKEENDWNSSREHCSAHGASLATIGSAEEMDFMMRFQGPANCWIGLHREEEDAQWTWSDGTAFTNWSVCMSRCPGHDFPQALFGMGTFSWCHSRGLPWPARLRLGAPP